MFVNKGQTSQGGKGDLHQTNRNPPAKLVIPGVTLQMVCFGGGVEREQKTDAALNY